MQFTENEGFTFNLFKVNWIDKNDVPYNVSIGISKFANLPEVCRLLWKEIERACTDPDSYPEWVRACGSARKEWYKGNRIDCTSAVSLEIPAVGKGVANQVKGAARRHYDSIKILATDECEIDLRYQMPAIVTQLDTFLDDLPAYNRNYVLGKRK